MAQELFCITKKRPSLYWQVIMPLIGTILFTWFAVRKLLSLITGVNDQSVETIILTVIAMLLLSGMAWQIVYFFKVGKKLVRFTDEGIVFPKETVTIRRIKSLSVDKQQISITKTNDRLVGLDLSLYTSGLSETELKAIADWAQQYGIAKFYGPEDQEKQWQEIEAEADQAEYEAKFDRPFPADYHPEPSETSADYSGEGGGHTKGLVWLMVIWSGLALLGLIILLVNLNDVFRVLYYLPRMYNTSVKNNLQDLKPGALVKLQGTVASDQAFTAVWNDQAAVYEYQIYVKAGSRHQTRETVVNKLVPFWIETGGGRIWVQPSNKFGARDLMMVREAGTTPSYHR